MTVLALEAGGEPYPENVTNPALWYTLFGTPVDWGYLSVPQKALGGRPTYEPRGKMPGGSSNLYIMMHIRGHPSDYDNWAYNGCPGWSYDECLAVLPEAGGPGGRHEPDRRQGRADPRLERGPARPEPDLAGVPRRVRRARLPVDRRLQRPEHGGRRLAPHQRQGRQALLARSEGYLEPDAYRENLTLSTHSQATRLILEGGRCVGVEYVKDGQKQSRRARRAR